MNHKRLLQGILLINCGILLIACDPSSPDGQYLRQAFGGDSQQSSEAESSAAAADSPTPVEPSSTTRQTYSQGGGLTPDQLFFLRHNVASGQTYNAMLSLRRRGLIGSPNEVSEDSEVYYIQGSSDGVTPPQKFVIQYRPSPKCNYECTEGTWMLKQQ